MGLGLYASAPLPRKGLLRRPLNQADTFAMIERAVRAAITDPLESRLLAFRENQHHLEVTLDPSSEPVYFEWNPAGAIVVSAKTSTAGPGYHAFVVDLLGGVARGCGFEFDWGPGGEGDETGYAQARDYGALRAAMARHAQALADMLLGPDMEGCTSLLVHWPMDLPQPHGPWFAVTPFGPLSREWLTEVKREPTAALLRQLFIWMEPARDGRYWAGLTRMLLWSGVTWRPPTDDQEQETCELCLAAAERARSLGAEVPEVELAELGRLLAHEDGQPLTPPDPTRIGYFRHPMWRQIAGEWTVQVPGYYFCEVTDDGATTVYGFGDRVVHCGSMTFTGPDKSLEELMGADSTEETGELVEHREEHLLGRARITKCADDDGRAGFMLQGRMITHGSVALMTITYCDAADHEWARSVFRSIAHPSPSDDRG